MPDPIEVITPQPSVAGTAPIIAPADPVAAASPGQAASPAPVVETPSAAGAVVTAEPVAALETPVVEPSLLEKFDAEKKGDPKRADKPADPAKPAEAAKPGDPEKPAEASPELPKVEYKYDLPETIKMDDAQKGEFTSALDKFRADPAGGAQGLIDLHNKALQSFAEQSTANQYKVWNDTRAEWRTKVMADPELGGSGHQTAMGAIARMRDLLVGEKEAPAFEDFLRATGAGDHPAFLRMLHNAARYFDEPALPPPGAKPSPNNGKPPGRGRLYDHPTSNR